MCNDYANHVPWSEYVEAFSDIKLPVVLPKAALNLEPRDDIWPTDPAPIIRPTEGGVEIAQVRWGFSPPRPKAPPVINFRSEGRKFERGRCLVPASWFYEFRGAKAPKEKWRFKRAGQDWFCFAGIWRPANANGPEAFMLLTSPGRTSRRFTTGRSSSSSVRTGRDGSMQASRRPTCCTPCRKARSSG
jgi:putative SOS response-associated peptidase YedK